MSTAELESVFVFTRNDNMNDSGSVFLLIETFKHQVITIGTLIVNQIIGSITISPLFPLSSKDKRVGLLADFTLKRFPIERLEASTIFHLLLYIEPASEALKVDISDRSRTFASREKGIEICCRGVPAEPTSRYLFILHVIWVKVMKLMVGN